MAKFTFKRLTYTDSEGNIVKKKSGTLAKAPKKGVKKGSMPKPPKKMKNGMPF
jgi:hypothetical protein